MRNDDAEGFLLKFPPYIVGYFAIVINNQDAHHSLIFGSLSGAGSFT
jgi:hypothetical protein